MLGPFIGDICRTVVDERVEVVRLLGEHDVSSAPDVRNVLEAAQQAAPGVVLDLSETTFIHSSIVSAIFAAQARRAIVLQLAPHVPFLRVLEIAGVLASIRSEASRDDAVRTALELTAGG